jgi:hypothetical protein
MYFLQVDLPSNFLSLANPQLEPQSESVQKVNLLNYSQIYFNLLTILRRTTRMFLLRKE